MQPEPGGDRTREPKNPTRTETERLIDAVRKQTLESRRKRSKR